MPRVLVFGGAGMLGHMVVRHLRTVPGLEVDCTGRRSEEGMLPLDLGDPGDALPAFLDCHGPYEYCINCIGVTRGGESGSDWLRGAIRVNALFPHQLVHAAESRGLRVIHMSTDGVFAGRETVYYEESSHDCLDAYGRTKGLGEVEVPHALTIRCSIVGPDLEKRRGLFEWYRRQPQSEAVFGYTNHTWHGATTLQFAELCRCLIRGDGFTMARAESAIHHFCPNEPMSKFDLLRAFQRLLAHATQVVPSEAPGTPVRRVLGSRFRSLGVLCPPAACFDDALRDMIGADVPS